MTVHYKGSVTAVILKLLLYKTLSYQQVENLLQPKPDQPKSRVIPGNTIRCTLSRLKKQGLVTRTPTGWQITPDGKSHWQKKLARAKTSGGGPASYKPPSKTNNRAGNLMIIFYDIPENRRADRDWLRRELQNLNFEMKQQSVWIGQAPLPQELVRSLKDLGLIKFCNFFRVKKGEII